jgi:transcription elongation factor Elf1
MDITFNCPHCGVTLEVDSDASGQQFNCPSCAKSVTVPASGPSSIRPPSRQLPPVPKDDKKYAVPVTDRPTESLIKKPSKTLEASAKDAKPGLKVRTIRHSDCKEVGKDLFDSIVSEFLAEIGDQAIVSITPINYSYVDLGTQKLLTDFGVMIVFRG